MYKNEVKEPKMVRYAAFGDSYTIGMGAGKGEAWPDVMVKNLRMKQIPLALVANPARGGWTTLDVLSSELQVAEKAKLDFVTLMIGTNDWVQGMTEADFRKNFQTIITRLQNLLPDKSKILIVNIPDFSVTPQGKEYGSPDSIKAGLARFNRIISAEALKNKLKVVDIYSLSPKMTADYISEDGLHPSAKGYAYSESIIEPYAVELLKDSKD